MVYRFILVSDEVENFRRDIVIDSDATFFELHEAILDSVSYEKDQITSFFLCDDDWAKQTEITLIDMDSGSDEDNYVMDTCRLSELLDDERQKLIYVFDPLTERCFFMELREITSGSLPSKPQTVKSAGDPPQQTVRIEDLDISPATIVRGLDDEEAEDFYDEFSENHYNEEDLEDLTEGNPFDY
jgi:hypothetical protein